MAGETRTLKVVILGDGKGAAGAVKETASEMDKLDTKTKETEKGWAKFTGSIKSVGEAVKGFAVGANKSMGSIDTTRIDKQLIATYARVVELNKQFALTGDKELFKQARTDQALLNKLRKVRNELTDVGAEAVKAGTQLGFAMGKDVGKSVSSGLASAFQSLPPPVQAAIIAGIVTAVAGAAPFLGGIVAGAVVGGVGIGGVVGGIAIAAQHPAVQEAAKQVGTVFGDTMKTSGASFVPVVVEALGLIKTQIIDLAVPLESIFQRAASFVRPLTDGVNGFLRNLLPGVDDALSRARPVIAELASWGPKLGTLLSDVFSQLSQHSVEGARALSLLWAVFDFGTRSIIATLSALSVAYGWVEKIALFLSGQHTKLGALVAAEEAAKQSNKGLTGSLQETIDKFGSFTTATAAAVAPIETFEAAMKRITQQNFDARASTRAMEEAIDAATASLKQNGVTLDNNSPKGRANAAALDAIASSANAAYQATLTQTGSQETANGVLERGKTQFMAIATAMGMSTAAARSLAGQLFAIPSPKPTISVQNQQALAAIRDVVNNLDGVRSKNVSVGVWWQSNGDLKLPGGTQLRASGGPVEPGQPYIVGEKGPELVTFGQSGMVHDATKTAAMMSAGNGLAGRALSGAGAAIQVVVNVAGNVTSEQNLARSIASTVLDEIVRGGKRNGGRNGLG